MPLKIKKGEYQHAADRLKERYGLTYTHELKHRIVREIKREKRRLDTWRNDEIVALLLQREPSGRERWEVRIDGVALHLMFEPVGGVIVTFLPPRSVYVPKRFLKEAKA